MSERAPSPPEVRRRRRRQVAQLLFLIVLLLGAEVGLRLIAPYRLAGAGNTWAPNAARYGWGFAPGAEVELFDPDSGASIVDRANSGGWRDLEREREKPPGRFRVVALGDSVTFGAITRAEDGWTRQLERLLRARGFDAEVVNLSYGGWGTDQELEALRLEGLSYAPDVVIVQFTTNDLGDVLRRGQKPFRYEPLPDGRGAIRRDEPMSLTPPPGWFVTQVVLRSELLKRLWFAGHGRSDLGERPSPARWGYLVGTEAIDVLTANLGRRADGIAAELLPLLGRELSRDQVEALIVRHGLTDQAELVRRAIEHHWFKSYWGPKAFRPDPVDTTDAQWTCWRAIMVELHRAAAGGGADLAVLSECDEGAYRWQREWYRIDPAPEFRARFLQPTEVIREFAAREGVGFVERRRPATRARNDPHPNAAGNAALAEDALEYLLRAHADTLARCRSR